MTLLDRELYSILLTRNMRERDTIKSRRYWSRQRFQQFPLIGWWMRLFWWALSCRSILSTQILKIWGSEPCREQSKSNCKGIRYKWWTYKALNQRSFTRCRWWCSWENPCYTYHFQILVPGCIHHACYWFSDWFVCWLRSDLSSAERWWVENVQFIIITCIIENVKYVSF